MEKQKFSEIGLAQRNIWVEIRKLEVSVAPRYQWTHEYLLVQWFLTFFYIFYPFIKQDYQIYPQYTLVY